MGRSEIKKARATVYLTPGILEGATFIMTGSALFYMVWYWENRFKGFR